MVFIEWISWNATNYNDVQMLADVKYIKMQASLRKQLYIKNKTIIFLNVWIALYENR